MARLGIIVSGTVTSVNEIETALDIAPSAKDFVIVAANPTVCEWAEDEGLPFESVPGNKVLSLSDELLLIRKGDDDEMESWERRATQQGKKTTQIDLGGPQTGDVPRVAPPPDAEAPATPG